MQVKDLNLSNVQRQKLVRYMKEHNELRSQTVATKDRTFGAEKSALKDVI